MRSQRSQCVAKWESDYRVVLCLRPAHDGDAEAAAASKPGKRPRKGNQSQKAPKAVKQRGPFEKLDKVITISRQLPTIQLVDAVWANTFDWLSHINKKAVTYLQKQYFKSVTVENLAKRYRCREAMRGDWLWFATFWSGIIGTYPGSAPGTQTIESFHSAWQSKVQKSARLSPVDIFTYMQQHFEEEWSHTFCWEEEKTFLTWPSEPAQELLNGQSLRSAGRSPAIDYWNHREKKLTGRCNYCKVYQRTSGTDADASKGITTFWVMQARKKGKVRAAEAEVAVAEAKLVTELIVAEGKKLEDLLCKCGCITNDARGRTIDEKRWEELFLNFAVVMQGDLPNSAWPRASRDLDVAADSVLCTCLPFLMHAECEHVLFVKALEDMEGVSLKGIRAVQKRGRKKRRPRDSSDS